MGDHSKARPRPPPVAEYPGEDNKMEGDYTKRRPNYHKTDWSFFRKYIDNGIHAVSMVESTPNSFEAFCDLMKFSEANSVSIQANSNREIPWMKVQLKHRIQKRNEFPMDLTTNRRLSVDDSRHHQSISGI